MPGNDGSTGLLEFGAYQQSHSKIRELKASLAQDQIASLAREVLRRLGARDETLDHVPHAPSPSELDALCGALVSEDDEAAARYIVKVRADGASPEDVYLKYLAAAARLLGQWWEENKISFVDVTIGTGRMFAIMRGMKHLFDRRDVSPGKTAIFASVPGETHTLGVRMAADLFRKDGWEIVLKLGLDHDELVQEIVHAPGNVIGLSISGRHSIDALSRLVIALRICCPQVPIVVSGQNIEEIRPLLDLVGVDGVAEDIDDAKAQISALRLA